LTSCKKKKNEDMTDKQYRRGGKIVWPGGKKSRNAPSGLITQEKKKTSFPSCLDRGNLSKKKESIVITEGLASFASFGRERKGIRPLGAGGGNEKARTAGKGE